MIYTFKETDYVTFINQLNTLQTVEFKISKTNNRKLTQTTLAVSAWESNIKEFIKNSIAPDASFFEEIVEYFERSILDDFGISSYGRDTFGSSILDEYGVAKENPFIRNIRRLESRIDGVKNNIETIKEYIKICEPLSSKVIPEIYSIQEKFDFILEKLNILASEKFYSVETILRLNDIDFRKGETGEIAVLLAKKGYVTKAKAYDDDNDDIKITVKGSAYIERQLKLKAKTKTKTSTTSKNDDLNKKIDEILDRLTKLNFGQEIIFEELEEMRSLQGKLSKKSWGQLLKGKLIDLAVGQVINKEMASDIFKSLTDEGMKFLK